MNVWAIKRAFNWLNNPEIDGRSSTCAEVLILSHNLCRNDLARSYKPSSTTTMAISSIEVSVLMMMSSSLISLQLNVCARVCIHPR